MKMLLNGEWVDRESKIDVIDPFNNEIIDTVPSGNAEDVKLAITAAVEGFQVMRKLSTLKRIEILQVTSEIVKNNQEEFATIIAREGSKTIREAKKEAYRCTTTLDVSAEEARRVVGETINFDQSEGSKNRRGYYYRFPIGVIAAITPFNDPLNLVAHKLGPAFAGGNSIVLKPATVTPLSALKLGEAFFEAGLPPKALNIITGYGSEIGDTLVTDPRIRMVSFTGGVEAGKHIASIAGLKKIGMELGSNSPAIVLADCDMVNAVECCVSGAFWAAGQNCLGVQRIYVEKPVYDEFLNKFVERTKKYKVGPKLDSDCDMGPMITEKEAIRIEKWVDDAIKLGAKVELGHKREKAIYWPTVLTSVPEACQVDCDEVFAPVVSIYPIDNLDEAIQKSNDVDYGLQAGIFTSNLNKAFKAIEELEVGGVIINDTSDYRVDAMPFGGVKNSGLGREGIRFALQEMTEPKVVCFNL
ncbi:MAG: aldehyde dehydrogenase family protein [Candidatus Hodarchaeales archaeon]|jgi:glyceraldehyde-3-phosphate dehydrogenase (NADP+)